MPTTRKQKWQRRSNTGKSKETTLARRTLSTCFWAAMCSRRPTSIAQQESSTQDAWPAKINTGASRMCKCRLLTTPTGARKGNWEVDIAVRALSPAAGDLVDEFPATRFPPIDPITSARSSTLPPALAAPGISSARRNPVEPAICWTPSAVSPATHILPPGGLDNWLKTRSTDASARTKRGGLPGASIGSRVAAEPKTQMLRSGPENQSRGPSAHRRAAESEKTATLRGGPTDQPQRPAPLRAPGGQRKTQTLTGGPERQETGGQQAANQILAARPPRAAKRALGPCSFPRRAPRRGAARG